MTAPSVWRHGDGSLWWGHDCGELGWTRLQLHRHGSALTPHGLVVGPDIRCERCGLHGWWREGGWQEITFERPPGFVA